jgi:hypothetical protein
MEEASSAITPTIHGSSFRGPSAGDRIKSHSPLLRNILLPRV